LDSCGDDEGEREGHVGEGVVGLGGTDGEGERLLPRPLAGDGLGMRPVALFLADSVVTADEDIITGYGGFALRSPHAQTTRSTAFEC
jgi:hypothetical protein